MRYTVAELRMRRLRVPALVAGAVVAAATAGFILVQGIGAPGTGAFAETPARADGAPNAGTAPPSQQADGEPVGVPAPPHDAAPASGDLPAGTSVFATGLQGIDGLDPDLLAALRDAASDSGIEFTITSGWRSQHDQQQLLAEAIVEYGSEAEAARWVATPETSVHVRGEAVDLGPWEATEWLAEVGAGYGLCRLYDNEPWHFELVASAPTSGCPALLPDPSHDPRLQ
ncbi:M15 family metallopeptidase [Leucobacter aridicollis]|uniref:M15 family metallopeptidase n=1 Tax=Leucobacter aridicollis TaxID=283878 RepID=UPI0037CA28BA